MSIAEDHEESHVAAHSYFVPMVDMLAGVVFILVILLAAVSLVSREEFTTASEMQTEVKRIEKELQAARLEEAQYLDPRREAKEALRVLLHRLNVKLADRGVTSRMLIDEGRLGIRLSEGFAAQGLSLSAQGVRVAEILGRTLAEELPCLSVERAGRQDCGVYPNVILDNVGVSLRDDESLPAAPQGARALSLLSRMVVAEPHLLELHAAQGASLVDYRQSAPPADAGDEAKRLPGQADIDLKFQFLLPALPK